LTAVPALLRLHHGIEEALLVGDVVIDDDADPVF
jgi:hypothetical protein